MPSVAQLQIAGWSADGHVFDQVDATNLLKAILGNTSYTTVTATNLRLGTNTPTATGAMTELGGGTGYTTGGASVTWNAVSAAATSNSNTVSWTNSGSSWSIVGLEIWDTAGSPLRHLFGTWTGQPITVATGNTFQVAAAGISVSLALPGKASPSAEVGTRERSPSWLAGQGGGTLLDHRHLHLIRVLGRPFRGHHRRLPVLG